MKNFIHSVLISLSVLCALFLLACLFITLTDPRTAFSRALSNGLHVSDLEKIHPGRSQKWMIKEDHTPLIRYKIPIDAVWEYSFSLDFFDTWCRVYTDSKGYVVGHYWYYDFM